MRTANASIKIDSGLDGYALQSTYDLENEILFRKALDVSERITARCACWQARNPMLAVD